MKRVRNILLIWGMGSVICSIMTTFFVYCAYLERGYWAIGGEYGLVPVMIILCIWVTDAVYRKHRK